MSITNKTNRKYPSAEQRSVLNTVVRRSAVEKDTPFITEDRIPAGEYRTEVVGVFESINSKGKPALDIVYRMVDSSGTSRHAKERLNLDGYMLEALVEHWLDAGQLDETATYADIQGIKETVCVVYTRSGSLGTIQNRKPRKGLGSSRTTAKPTANKVSIVKREEDDEHNLLRDDDEDDYNDYLPMEDDD